MLSYSRPPRAAKPFPDRELLGAQFGEVAFVPSGMIAKLDDLVCGRVHVLASATVRWCFTAANRVMIRSVRHSLHAATAKGLGLRSLGSRPRPLLSIACDVTAQVEQVELDARVLRFSTTLSERNRRSSFAVTTMSPRSNYASRS